MPKQCVSCRLGPFHQQNNKLLTPFSALFIAFSLIGKDKSTKSDERIKDFSSAGLFCLVKLWSNYKNLLYHYVLRKHVLSTFHTGA